MMRITEEKLATIVQANAALKPDEAGKISAGDVIGMASRIEFLERQFHRLDDWAQAYPLQCFPEPDLKRAHEILQEHGMTLDAISASNMRHVIGQTKSIVDAALAA